jgi:hypothetical protein
MKKYSKIFIIVIISSLLVTSSCKKDELIIEGCTDSAAMNYNATATSNDGSCIFAYDIAQGSWDITPDCDDITIPPPPLPPLTTISLNDQLPESIDVQGGEDNSLYIEIDGTQVTGDIDNNGNIIVSEQTIQVDFGLGIPIDVQVSGSGKIESENTGFIDLTYAFVVQGFPLSTSCHITLSR